MTIEACADLVRRGDPDRFLSTMTAKPADRAALFTLYAFNLEVARAPWVTAEPMIAEMRLQWWFDAIEEIYAGGLVRSHEVVTPLAKTIQLHGLEREPFDALIKARQWDIYKEPHENSGALDRYITDTAGGLMWLSANALGATEHIKAAIYDYGYGAGVAALMRAVPALENAQKYPLVDGTHAGVRHLAEQALQKMQSAKPDMMNAPSQVRSAFRTAWLAESILKTVMQNPEYVAVDMLALAEFTKKIKLLWKSTINGF